MGRWRLTACEVCRLSYVLLPRVPMRLLIAIAGMLVGSLLLAPPAFAHASHKTAPAQAAPPASAQTATAQEREPLLGVCELPRERFIAVDTPDPVDHTRTSGESDVHTPADHSHPIGSDTFHDKASHGSLDVAHEARPVVVAGAATAKPAERSGDDAACGIAVKPPVPPPLG